MANESNFCSISNALFSLNFALLQPPPFIFTICILSEVNLSLSLLWFKLNLLLSLFADGVLTCIENNGPNVSTSMFIEKRKPVESWLEKSLIVEAQIGNLSTNVRQKKRRHIPKMRTYNVVQLNSWVSIGAHQHLLSYPLNAHILWRKFEFSKCSLVSLPIPIWIFSC